MKWGKCRWGSLKVDGKRFTKDVILDQGGLRKRKKKPSRAFREQFGHTPVSLQESIPWQCKRLVIGTGMEGRLPVMDEMATEARRRVGAAPHPRGGRTPSATASRYQRHSACDLLKPVAGLEGSCPAAAVVLCRHGGGLP